jgi:hypothetical protein
MQPIAKLLSAAVLIAGISAPAHAALIARAGPATLKPWNRSSPWLRLHRTPRSVSPRCAGFFFHVVRDRSNPALDGLLPE